MCIRDSYYPSEVAQLADHVLYVAANESLFRNGAMSSRLSQLNVMDILYTCLLYTSPLPAKLRCSRAEIPGQDRSPGGGRSCAWR